MDLSQSLADLPKAFQHQPWSGLPDLRLHRPSPASRAAPASAPEACRHILLPLSVFARRFTFPSAHFLDFRVPLSSLGRHFRALLFPSSFSHHLRLVVFSNSSTWPNSCVRRSSARRSRSLAGTIPRTIKRISGWNRHTDFPQVYGPTARRHGRVRSRLVPSHIPRQYRSCSLTHSSARPRISLPDKPSLSRRS